MLLRTALTALLATAAGSAFAADAVRPAPAAPKPIVVAGPAAAGDLSIGAGGLWENLGGSTGNGGTAEAVARASVPFGQMWNFEAQVNAADFFFHEGGTTVGAPFQAAGYLHLWERKPSSAWGLFAGISPFEANFTSVGGEFVHYLPHASLGAAVAATFLSSGLGPGSSGTTTGWTVNGSANFYPMPDARIGITAAALTGIDVGGSNNTIWQVTGDLEHRMSRGPMSLWASAGYESEFGELTVWTALAGFRIFLDRPSSTLQSHEMDVPFTFILPQLNAG